MPMPGVRHPDLGHADPAPAISDTVPPAGVYLAALFKQIGDDLGQAGVIGIEPDRLGRQVDVEFMPGRVEIELAGLDRRPEDRAQLDPLLLQRNLAFADPGDVEQVLDQAGRWSAPLHLFPDVLARSGRRASAAGAGLRRARRPGCAVRAPAPRGTVLVPVRAFQAPGRRSSSSRCAAIWLALAIQVEEDIGLAAQDVGLDRLLDEVDRACFIAAEAALVVGAARGHEDDRDMPVRVRCRA
jgi:hypothetical protein